MRIGSQLLLFDHIYREVHEIRVIDNLEKLSHILMSAERQRYFSHH